MAMAETEKQDDRSGSGAGQRAGVGMGRETTAPREGVAIGRGPRSRTGAGWDAGLAERRVRGDPPPPAARLPRAVQIKIAQ